MSRVGIIAEFNPLHTGHKFLIDTAKQNGNTVIAVISGNFVQRGDTAILSKSKRAEMALRCGVDLVAELPVIWSMSTAQNFAIGGVTQLARLGCDEILFGSECGDIGALINAADILLSKEFDLEVSNEIKNGITFAAARQIAAEKLGVKPNLLTTANNNLGIEYICAAKKLGIDIKFRTIKRIGSGHDSKDINETAVSASLLREKIIDGNFGFAEKFMPIEARGILKPEIVSDIARLEKAILSVLRMKTKEDFKNLPDLSEGLDNKLLLSVRVATSLDDLYSMIKSKRYTLARVRRLVLSAFLSIDNSLFLKPPPYTRILGSTDKGNEVLASVTNKALIVTKASEIKGLGPVAQKVFDTESKATDIFALSLLKPHGCGKEFTSKFLKF